MICPTSKKYISMETTYLVDLRLTDNQRDEFNIDMNVFDILKLVDI